jgi:hypothetical protein
MAYLVKTTGYQPLDIDRDDLLSISEAADVLGLTLPGLIAAMNRGELREVIDDEAPMYWRDRRFVLRSEVEAARERRAEP